MAGLVVATLEALDFAEHTPPSVHTSAEPEATSENTKVFECMCEPGVSPCVHHLDVQRWELQKYMLKWDQCNIGTNALIGYLCSPNVGN